VDVRVEVEVLAKGVEGHNDAGRAFGAVERCAESLRGPCAGGA
jgi:hypothetical protein